ncbi:unnamed protein product [Lampetra planeri]
MRRVHREHAGKRKGFTRIGRDEQRGVASVGSKRRPLLSASPNPRRPLRDKAGQAATAAHLAFPKAPPFVVFAASLMNGRSRAVRRGSCEHDREHTAVLSRVPRQLGEMSRRSRSGVVTTHGSFVLL